MDSVALIEQIGEPAVATLAGLIAGLIFGFSAEQGQFCLRAVAVEVARFRMGLRFSV